jgi:dGTPase
MTQPNDPASEPMAPSLAPTEMMDAWAATMTGNTSAGLTAPHAGEPVRLGRPRTANRVEREQRQAAELSDGATVANGAGTRAIPEEPDELRTCFERDRDRILGSKPFRRLSGKTQVMLFPGDHVRTRLTHALEVAQVAVAIATGCGLNRDLAEAIALGHDCGHGPGGHASEDALAVFLPEGFNHAVFGADVALAPLNLCAETLDGVRNHSWSRPRPATPEGVAVAFADRIAYCTHDFEDAVAAGIIGVADLPTEVAERLGRDRSAQIKALVRDVVATVAATGTMAMSAPVAAALGEFRRFNNERIYLRPASLVQSHSLIPMLRALVEFYADRPNLIPDITNLDSGSDTAVRAAVAHVAGMTDRYACRQAVADLGWERHQLPRGVDLGHLDH